MKDVTFSEAAELILKHTVRGPVKKIRTAELSSDPEAAGGYILAESVFADRNLPPFNRSAMDGFAIRAADYAPDRPFFVIGTLTAGNPDPYGDPYKSDQSEKSPFALRIMTGAPVPLWADAVIRFEDSECKESESFVKFTRKSAEPWMNVARSGEDAEKGSVLLEAGSPVNSSTLPVIAACGYSEIHVYSKPKIFLVTTGTEVIGIDENPLDHQIRDSSSWSLKYLAAKKGIRLDSVKVKDEPEQITAAFQKGLNEYDILLITGGVSKGITDQVPQLLKNLGVEEVFHRAKIKPGKPIFFGIKDTGGKRVLAFGLPGSPVSTQVNFKIFVEEAIDRFAGAPRRVPLRLPLCRSKTKKHELQEFTQCRVGIQNGLTCIEPLSHHGSGDFVNMALTDGLMIHPAENPEIKEGETADFIFW